MYISQNLNSVKHNISTAINRRNANLDRNEQVKLVAVTKNHPTSAIFEAIEAGVGAIGENRVQEALAKHPAIGVKTEWHLLGHLQTNKVKQALPIFNLIHSVDSDHLAIEINRVAGKLGKIQDILIQVNVAAEESKFGISPDKLFEFSSFVANLENIKLCGLMTIAPFFENIEYTRPIFRETYRLFMELRKLGIPNADIKWLSMGMTNDYVVAVEEGANLVRIGTAIFGERQY